MDEKVQGSPDLTQKVLDRREHSVSPAMFAPRVSEIGVQAARPAKPRGVRIHAFAPPRAPVRLWNAVRIVVLVPPPVGPAHVVKQDDREPTT